jgi:hypothetical protein
MNPMGPVMNSSSHKIIPNNNPVGARVFADVSNWGFLLSNGMVGGVRVLHECVPANIDTVWGSSSYCFHSGC